MKKRGLSLLSGVVMAIAPHIAAAHAPIELERQTFIERTRTDVNGRARRILLTANRATPGDRLVVVLRWRNAGDRPIVRPTLTDAVPPGAQFDLDDPAMSVSVDGGQRWGRLDRFWLPTPLGGMRRAVAADITHVRWTLDRPVSPGDSGRISFRAVAR